MTEYRFYDTDASGSAEYDIAGAEYLALLQKCFEYCVSLSFYVRSADVSSPSCLEPYRLPLTQSVIGNHQQYPGSGQIHHYQLSQDSLRCILSITDSIFKWIDGWGQHNPEDPIFYRADGSIFLSACIHEGKISLFPHHNEDVSSIIQNPLWNQIASE